MNRFLIVIAIVLSVAFGLALKAHAQNAGEPRAVIYFPTNPDPNGSTQRIAPYTVQFSGIDSIALPDAGGEIVRWDWDFDDDRSRDARIDEGMLVAHRFDHPGTYNIRLTVTDANGRQNSTTRQMIVTAFSGPTYYVSSTQGNDQNTGRLPEQAWQSIVHAFATARGTPNNPVRLLFRRGDTWTMPIAMVNGRPRNISPIEPIFMDAYGQGARPIFDFDVADAGMTIAGGWEEASRIENIHFRYTGSPRVSDYLLNTPSKGLIVRNILMEHGGIESGHQEATVIEDSEVFLGGVQGWYATGNSITSRRNIFRGAGNISTHDHQHYWSTGARWLIEEVLFDGMSTNGNNFATKLKEGHGIVIRGSESRNTRNGFSFSADARPGRSDTASRNVIVENSITHHNGLDAQAAGMRIGWVNKVIIRNNLIYENDKVANLGRPEAGDSGTAGIMISEAKDINLSDIRIVNNTFYGNETPDIWFRDPTEAAPGGYHTVEVRNNIFYRVESPARNTVFFRMENPQAYLPRISSDHNMFFWVNTPSSSNETFKIGPSSRDLHSFSVWQQTFGQDQNSVWLDPGLENPSQYNFNLLANSAAINRAIPLPYVFQDKLGVTRDQGGRPNMGAFERLQGVPGNQLPAPINLRVADQGQ